MKKIRIVSFLTIFLFSISSLAHAQATALLEFGGEFLLALVAGIILAFGFQAVFTLISVAAGISIVGPLNKSSSHNDKSKDKSSQKNSSSNMGTKISSAAGIWTLLTVSISLFFATLLSLKLILVDSNTLALVLSLVIWAAFFTTMMYLEMKSVSSLAGGLFNLATGVVKSSFSSVKNIFESNQQNKIEHTIDNSIDKIRAEVNEQWNSDSIVEKLDEYIEKLQPEPLDYKRIEEELKNVIDEIEVEHRTELGENGLDERTFLHIAERQPNMSKEDVKKAGDLFNKVKSANQEGESKTAKVTAGIDKLTPGSEEDTARFRQKIADYLRNTDAEEVQPEKFEHDLEVIMNDPKSSKEVVMHRVSTMNRNTLKELIKGSDGMSDEKADKIVTKAESAINRLKSVMQSAPTLNQSKMDEANERGGQIQGEYKGKAQGKKLDMEMKLRTFFNSMNRREFNYERMKLDFMRMLKDPKSAPGVLKRRLQEYDRESFIALLSKNKNISREKAEKMFRKFDEARDNIISKAEQIENQVSQKYNQFRQGTFNQMEGARKTAAVAAWWLVATAIFSGGAAVLGGILAIV